MLMSPMRDGRRDKQTTREDRSTQLLIWVLQKAHWKEQTTCHLKGLQGVKNIFILGNPGCRFSVWFCCATVLLQGCCVQIFVQINAQLVKRVNGVWKVNSINPPKICLHFLENSAAKKIMTILKKMLGKIMVNVQKSLKRFVSNTSNI